MVPACPSCGFTFQRGEQGYWLGAYFFNLVAIEVIFCAWWAGVLLATWPGIPWRFLHLTTIALMVATPVAFFRWSKTLFLAFDLWVRPATDEDFAAPAEASPRRGLRSG